MRGYTQPFPAVASASMTAYRDVEGGGLRTQSAANLEDAGNSSLPVLSNSGHVTTSSSQDQSSPGLARLSSSSFSSTPSSSSRMGSERASPDSRRGGAKSVSWGDLPKKQQLVVLTLARLSEPLVQTSLQVCCLFSKSYGGV